MTFSQPLIRTGASSADWKPRISPEGHGWILRSQTRAFNEGSVHKTTFIPTDGGLKDENTENPSAVCSLFPVEIRRLRHRFDPRRFLSAPRTNTVSDTSCTCCGSAEERHPRRIPGPRTARKKRKTMRKIGNINGNPRYQLPESRGNYVGALPAESIRINRQRKQAEEKPEKNRDHYV